FNNAILFNRSDMITRNLNKFLIALCLLLAAGGFPHAFAQYSDKGGSVTTVLTTHSSDGIFSSTASYTFEVNNSYKSRQVGKVSYLVTTEAGKKVKADS